MIAVRDGGANSLENIRRVHMNAQATKNIYATALLEYHAYLDDVKSDQRDEAAAYSDEYRYLLRPIEEG